VGAIEGVTTLAFLDVDGPKVKAVVVEYDQELTSGSVSADTYEVYTYTNIPQVTHWTTADDPVGYDEETFPGYSPVVAASGTPGEVTKVYVSKNATIGDGDSSGKYVIIEVNTAYQLNTVDANWRPKLAGGVKQVKAIRAGNISVPASETPVVNYAPGVTAPNTNPQGQTKVITSQLAIDGLYDIKDFDGFKLFTNEPDKTITSMVAGPAFPAKDCFSEVDGKLHDVNVVYSLFIPDDYQAQVAAGKKFALALHMEDGNVAGGTDPVIALTETNVAANYAQLGQEIVKDTGLGGLIVVLPQTGIYAAPVDDNWTGNEFIQATWQLLDHLTDVYAIDMNRIYASGQSMGGMQPLYMASHRDHYFAGIWSIGSQWANNYDKAVVPYCYNRGGNTNCSISYPYDVDGHYITNEHWKNWYWSLSDHNILITNMAGDKFATTLWQILRDYYSNLAGVVIPKTEWDPETTSVERQNELLRELLAQPTNGRGMYWNALSGGGHTQTWIYAHSITASYDWLLRQTRESADARGKLDNLAQKYVDGVTEGGTYCLSTGTASNGPNMSGMDDLDYQPRLSQVAGCDGGPWYTPTP
jgi:predicted peptidase